MGKRISGEAFAAAGVTGLAYNATLDQVELTKNLAVVTSGKQILADIGTTGAPGVAFYGTAALRATGLNAYAAGSGGGWGLSNAGALGVYQQAALVANVDTITAQRLTANGALTTASQRLATPATTKVANATISVAEFATAWTGAGLTATLPAAPTAGQQLLIINANTSGANTLTIGRNGKLINGAAADYVLAANAALHLEYNGTAGGWFTVAGP